MTENELRIIEAMLTISTPTDTVVSARQLLAEVKRLRRAIDLHRERDRHHLYKPYRHDLLLWDSLDADPEKNHGDT